ncbi:ribose-phosphate diphosphokinase [Parasphingorhabdus sp.]|uniref:ribose-phosphate diphosphokinase n=1 Tax=Parasphingorhabdus sp. TaxID=2709688 RepID=UPI003A90F96F
MQDSLALGQSISKRLGVPISAHEERDFENGEHKSRSLIEVGNRDAYVIHQLEGDAGQSANDKLVKLLFFIGSLKQAGAARVTAIAPYLPYSRKDRRTKSRDPVNSRYVAALFEAMRTDVLVTLEIHNIAAFENAFPICRAENLATARLMADHIRPVLGDGPVVVVSPDAGGAKRAELFRSVLEKDMGKPVGNAMLEKHRSADVVSGSLFAGDVKGRTAIIVDDMIGSGGTVMRAVQACRKHGAGKIYAVATHGLFTEGAATLFGEAGPDRIIVTDSVQAASGVQSDRLQIISVAGLLADAIDCLHNGNALYDLLPYN